MSKKSTSTGSKKSMTTGVDFYQVIVFSEISDYMTKNIQKHFLKREDALNFYRKQLEIMLEHTEDTKQDEDQEYELRLSIRKIKCIDNESVKFHD